MTVMEPTTAVARTGPAAYWPIPWSAIIAGAIAAAGLSFVLHSFAAGIGLAVSSSAPTWRDASFALVFLSGLYLILAAIAAYGFGGYVAGRLTPRADAVADDIDFRDGMNGLLVWALATLVTALLAMALVMTLPRLVAPSGGNSGAQTSVAGENIIAYDLDRLFRSDRRPAGIDMDTPRAEASRILLTTSSHRGMVQEDRDYLVRLVAGTTGVSAADADRRVTAVSATAKENLTRARRASILLGFMLGAAALLGAIAAWYASCAAGRHRDGREALSDLWDWGRPYTPPRSFAP